MSFNRTNEDVEIVLQIVKKLKCFDRYPMYVKRELAKVLYYDCFNRGRVVIKQGKLLPGQSGDDGGDGIDDDGDNCHKYDNSNDNNNNNNE